MFEQIPTPEFSAEELELIAKLKEKGPEEAATRELLNNWYDRESARADELNTGRANAEFTLKRARLYHAAGFLEEAWENLQDLRVQAAQETAHDLLEAAEVLMDEIDREPR